MKKRSKWLSKFIIVLVLILLITGAYVQYTIFTPVDSGNAENVSVIIKKGLSVKEIATDLKDEGLIRCKVGFYGYVRVTGSDKGIVAGRYLLNKSMTVPEIIETISTISESEFVVTIQEGLTISDIDDKLVDLSVIEDGEFENAVKEFSDFAVYPFIDAETVSVLEFPLEGYLYPDTYFLDAFDFDSDQLIHKMLDNFMNKFESVQANFDAQDRSMHETITMASILQREVRTEKDLNIVAGILWKRLDSNWHIGADATILYATKKKKIEVADLEIDSPYNTRLYTGMPPGPISNPDIEHIKATLTPEKSDYWYYLTTLDTGEVIYAKTNDDHNVNKAKYLY